MGVVIVGNTEYSEMLMDYIEDSGVVVDAFCVDKAYISKGAIAGKPVIPVEEITKIYPPEKTKLYLGIGYSNLGKTKKQVYDKLKREGYQFQNFIHKSVQIFRGCMLGEGNIFFENVVIQRNVTIGNANLFFSNANIMHDNCIGNYNTFGAGSVSNGFVKIGDCNFVGSNATLKDHIVLKGECLIGAGAYVNKVCEKGNAVLPAKANLSIGGGHSLVAKL